MPSVDFTESTAEHAALQCFALISYDIGHGPDLELSVSLGLPRSHPDTGFVIYFQ